MNQYTTHKVVQAQSDKLLELAQGVIWIKPDCTIESWYKPEKQLSLIAILGPTTHNHTFFEQAPLVELGLFRTRPYNKVHKQHPEKKKINLFSKRKHFGISNEQYELIAPTLFELLDQIRQHKTKNWKQKSVSQKTDQDYYHRKSKKLLPGSKLRDLEVGPRISVAPDFVQFIADVLWIEKNDPKILFQIKGLAKYIWILLSHYRTIQQNNKSVPRNDFPATPKNKNLKNVRLVKEEVLNRKWLNPHLYHLIPEHLTGGSKNLFYELLTEIMSELNTSPLQPQDPLPNPQARVGNTRLIVWNQKSNYVVVQLHDPNFITNQPDLPF